MATSCSYSEIIRRIIARRVTPLILLFNGVAKRSCSSDGGKLAAAVRMRPIPRHQRQLDRLRVRETMGGNGRLKREVAQDRESSEILAGNRRRSRPWVLSTPVDGEVVDMTLVSQVRTIRKPRRFYPDLQPAGRTTPREATGGGP